MVSTLRPSPTTVAQHLAGSAQSWHGKVSPEGPFPPEKDRYRLYIGLFCPFAHRVNLVRHLKNLQSTIPLAIVKPYPKGDDNGYPGWCFPVDEAEYPGATPDPELGAKYLHELYFQADPEYKGRYSVPALWDRHGKTIVNNESADLMRDLQTGFDSILSPGETEGGGPRVDLYPEELRERIDAVAKWMQRDLNIGVYRAGFAKTQDEYDSAVPRVFAALNVLEKMVYANKLAKRDGSGIEDQNRGFFILGGKLTELDIRAYATIVRFDTVYVQHFKCNLGTIRHNYPCLRQWLGGLYYGEGLLSAFRETTDFKHIKENYTKSHRDINPTGITPLGPWPDVEEPGSLDWDMEAKGPRTGGVKMPVVVDLEEELLRESGLEELLRL